MLKQKLLSIGLSNHTGENYIKDRTECVKVQNQKSSSFNCILGGVPQGLILGPLLFIICTYDLDKMIKNAKVHLCTDDTVLYPLALTSELAMLQLQIACNNIQNVFIT